MAKTVFSFTCNVVDLEFELDFDYIEEDFDDLNNLLEIKAHDFNNYLNTPMDSVFGSFTIFSVTACETIECSALDLVILFVLLDAQEPCYFQFL